MAKLIFKRVVEAGDPNDWSYSVVVNADHTIFRYRSWFRMGGEQFTFSCTCGWNASRCGFGAGKSNAPANRHADEVLAKVSA